MPHSSLLDLLWQLPYVPMAGAALLAGLRWRALPPSLRYLAWLAWFELPANLLSVLVGRLWGSNLFMMPIYTVVELWLLALVYRAALRSAAFTRWLPWVAGAFTVYVVLDSWLGASLKLFQPGQQVVQSLLLLGMVGVYFNKLLTELRVQRLTREPIFWVSIGLAIYFFGYLQIALFSNYLLRHYSQQFNHYVWAGNCLLLTVLHTCYCVALGLRPRPGSGPAAHAASSAASPGY